MTRVVTLLMCAEFLTIIMYSFLLRRYYPLRNTKSHTCPKQRLVQGLRRKCPGNGDYLLIIQANGVFV